MLTRSLIPIALCVAITAAAPRMSAQSSNLNINTAWLPITELERKMAAPVVDPNAGVEALFWRVYVFDEIVGGQDLQRVLQHYVRLKVFTEKGKEAAATIEIPYGGKEGIQNISGRTVKADGTIVELQGSAVRERDILRAGRFSRKAKTFAMPGVEPGAIVEYRWKEIRFDPGTLHMRLQFQREYPVQKVMYHLKPLSRDYTSYTMSVAPFNCDMPKFELDNQGFNFTTIVNVPAYKEEPMMPSAPNVRPWALVAYRDRQIKDAKDVQKYWDDEGKDWYRRLKVSLKVNDEIAAAATGAVEGAATDEEKVAKLIQFLRTKLRGLFDRSVSDGERKEVLNKMPKDRWRTAPEIYKSGIGIPNELNIVFAALAAKVGLDARPALVSDRDDVQFSPGLADSYFLPNLDIAVKIGEQWRVYDVNTRLLPASMVSWGEEGAAALISDPKQPLFVTTRTSDPSDSTTQRTGNLTLGEDGTLTGGIKAAYTGHAAASERSALVADAEGKRIERIKDDVLRVFPRAEVSDVKIEGVDDPEQPMQVSYTIRIPGYAQRTGKRMFFQPLATLRGEAAMFSAAERKFDIYFAHPWHEIDQITVQMPRGFKLDSAENPGGLAFGEPGEYKLNMSTSPDGQLVVNRELVFGKKGMIIYPAAAYPQLKKVFDEVHRRDSVNLALRQQDAQ